MKIFTFFLIVFINSILFSQTTGSYGFSDVTSTSLGKTYTSRATGVYAIGVNPANLAVNITNDINFTTLLPFPSLMMTIHTPIDIENYNYFFGGIQDATGKTIGRPLTFNDKENLKSLLGQNKFLMNFNLTYFSINYNSTPQVGSFAFAIVDKNGSDFKFAESLLDLVLVGNEIGKNYSLSDVVVKNSFYREYSFSYARKITDKKLWEFESIFGGVTFKYISGYNYISTSKNNSFIHFGDKNTIYGKWDYEVNLALPPDFFKNYGKDSIASIPSPQISPFPTQCGSGFGFDIGFTAKLMKIITVSLALTDIGSITWNTNTATISGSGDFSFKGYSTQEAIDSITEKFKNIKNAIGTEFSSSLPTTLRFGISYQFDKAPFIKSFPGELLIALDYNQGFNDEIGNSTTPRISLGAEWKPMKWVPIIRTGISLGGAMGAEWAFGLGYDTGPLEFNFALLNPVSLFTLDTSKKFVFGFDSRWKF